MSAINNVLDAFNAIGGKGSLQEIYDAVNRIEDTPEPSIRRTIYQHSSECDIYDFIKEDIFYAPEGKGKGVWAIRDKSFSQFPFQPGQNILRKELHKIVGGSVQGGICPTSSGHILLFSDPKHGEEFGYFDGWDGNIYLYYGQGQEGDMEFERNNKALENHKIDGRRVHLFKGAKGEITYENQFELDDERPYDLIEDIDKNDETRVAIIFRLKPIYEKATSLPQTNIKVLEDSSVEVVDVEQNISDTTSFVYPSEGKSERKESKLVTEYKEFRNKNNLEELKSLKIKIKGESHPLKTDGWIEESKILIEAKSSCSRTNIRSGVGQLLDYRFQLEQQGFKVNEMCLLLPTKPRENIVLFIQNTGVKLLYKKGKEFIT